MQDSENETIAYEPGLGFAVQARGPLSINTALLGSSSEGQDYRVDWRVGEALVGLDGFESGSRINQVVAKCIEVSDNGDWVGTPQPQDRTVGLTSGNTYSIDCASGSAMTDITGLTRNNAVASVQFHCNNLTGPKKTKGESTDSRVVGQDDWAIARQLCGSGGVATGIQGHENNELKGLGLVCHESPATAGRWSNPFNWPVQAVHAVMTPQGNILSYGFRNGISGTNALLIDISSGTPVTRPTNDMKTARSARVNSQVMADSKVMTIGGSRIDNDAVTAAPNAEIWDPATEEWTVFSGFKRPRLYHSNSVLLKDATVMIAGGGNPEPVTNYSAEIFSPPYLFNDDGKPAVRPVIDSALNLSSGMM